ncbi:TIGR04222 domain-containing membrane protein [Streptomyces abyssomicinicus]|uniref:TIGR04222 domain-containing membrane protein n=1 Tax=Streptomyces abyssomicinicus TaxID=574929 RepID=UPI0012500F0B|nr:TIGR04222 domain-containing membrane protein [Streptomyces abyssomicinicus]
MLWVSLLLVAWVLVGVACFHLCRAAVAATAAERLDDGRASLSLYETAFLAGGPVRVADLTLVAMARERRLLLAHTGWATVVDPRGRDEVEGSVIAAIGPGGQRRIAPVRAAAAAAEAVDRLADRLVAAGLAVPEHAGTVADGVRRVRSAAVAVAVLGAVAVVLPGEEGGPTAALTAAWFAAPLAMALGTLLIARMEAHPYPRRASPAGQRLVASLGHRVDELDEDLRHLTAVALHGLRAVEEPALRAAFAAGADEE